ncbi:MAG: hypothetical protein ACI4HI_04270 [Lachnospiraceae bacterium]
MKFKYYLRGLGIGIFCTTLLLTFEHHLDNSTMSNEEVISRAKELGMVMPSQESGELQEGEDANEEETDETKEKVSDSGQKTADAGSGAGAEADSYSEEKDEGENKKSSETEKKSSSTDEKATKSEEQKKASEKTGSGKSADVKEAHAMVNFEIHSGEYSDVVSQNLFQQGIVDNADSFNAFIVANHYDQKLQPGTYALPKGGTYEEIVKILVGR